MMVGSTRNRAYSNNLVVKKRKYTKRKNTQANEPNNAEAFFFFQIIIFNFVCYLYLKKNKKHKKKRKIKREIKERFNLFIYLILL
jgi:hypothetical protein